MIHGLAERRQPLARRDLADDCRRPADTTKRRCWLLAGTRRWTAIHGE